MPCPLWSYALCLVLSWIFYCQAVSEALELFADVHLALGGRSAPEVAACQVCCYAVVCTGAGYAATPWFVLAPGHAPACYAVTGTGVAYSATRLKKLRAWHAMPSTDTAHATTPPNHIQETAFLAELKRLQAEER
eukprot:2440775-Rhodomonas_salina.1